MPAIRVALEDIEQAVEDLEPTARILAAFSVGDGAAVLITEVKRGPGRPPKEVRA